MKHCSCFFLLHNQCKLKCNIFIYLSYKSTGTKRFTGLRINEAVQILYNQIVQNIEPKVHIVSLQESERTTNV